MRPAGFWRRCVAWSFDAVPVAAIAAIAARPWLGPALTRLREDGDALYGLVGERIGEGALAGTPFAVLGAAMVRDPALGEAAFALHLALWSLAVPAVLAFAAVGAAWNAWGENTRWGGSPGKRLLGLRVTGRDGGPPGIGRSLLRHFAGALSWATLNLGHAAAAIPPHRLALHDRIAGTRVVAANDAPLPWWGWGWLALLLAAGVGLAAWCLRATSAAMTAGVERALS